MAGIHSPQKSASFFLLFFSGDILKKIWSIFKFYFFENRLCLMIIACVLRIAYDLENGNLIETFNLIEKLTDYVK